MRVDLPLLFAWTIGVCSAVLTGIFGATFGGDSLFLVSLFFAVNVLLSALCPLAVNKCASLMLDGKYAAAGIVAIFVPVLIGWDLITNAGTSALFRQTELTEADNQNTNAANARAEVRRLEERIADIRRTTAWQGKYNSPAAYDELIASATQYIELEQKRGGCGSKCEARMKERDELVASQANAVKRETLRQELSVLDRELKEAKLRVVETPTKASASLAHAANISAGLTGQVDPGEEATFWANYGLSVAGGAIVTIGNILASVLLAFSHHSPAMQSRIREPSWDRNPLPAPGYSQPVQLIPASIDSNDTMRQFADLLDKINGNHEAAAKRGNA